MNKPAYQKLVDTLTLAAEPVLKQASFASLLDRIGDARFVLMGEATHGTAEFYQTRIELTKALIEQKQFMAVAIEGDWPDVYQIQRYIQGIGNKKDSRKALTAFKRFPSWMWRNTLLPPFLSWLRAYNEDHAMHEKIGFYGLDLYSLYSSMQAVIYYLDTVDVEAANRARRRYACFDHVQPDPQTYGYLTSLGIKKSCLKEAVSQLVELQHHAFDYVRHDGLPMDEYFYATQNARVVKNAENYYRSMYEGHIESWNVRDRHMAETFNVLADHLENRCGKPAKIIVWAHNSHVGDARATEMGEQGEVNIGQLIREQHDADAYLIGFSTYQGTVTAASDWDGPAETKRINPGLAGSYEELFHRIPHANFRIDLRDNKILEHYLHPPRLQRAIGVVYKPETERYSHYFFTHLPYQFDSIFHYDQTTAVQPLTELVCDNTLVK